MAAFIKNGDITFAQPARTLACTHSKAQGVAQGRNPVFACAWLLHVAALPEGLSSSCDTPVCCVHTLVESAVLRRGHVTSHVIPSEKRKVVIPEQLCCTSSVLHVITNPSEYQLLLLLLEPGNKEQNPPAVIQINAPNEKHTQLPFLLRSLKWGTSELIVMLFHQFFLFATRGISTKNSCDLQVFPPKTYFALFFFRLILTRHFYLIWTGYMTLEVTSTYKLLRKKVFPWHFCDSFKLQNHILGVLRRFSCFQYWVYCDI